MWKFDKDGRQLTIPEPGNDHALDAVRYALQSLQVRTPDVTSYKPKEMLTRKYGY
jgi:hypothetical protein